MKELYKDFKNHVDKMTKEDIEKSIAAAVEHSSGSCILDEEENYIEEKHILCPYEKECKSLAGYCHRWKIETTNLVNGKMIITKIIHDCDKPLTKI